MDNEERLKYLWNEVEKSVRINESELKDEQKATGEVDQVFSELKKKENTIITNEDKIVNVPLLESFPHKISTIGVFEPYRLYFFGKLKILDLDSQFCGYPSIL